MTVPRRRPAEPGTLRPDARPGIPYPLGKEDLLEVMEPSDYPKYPGHWFPEYPGPDELLDRRRARDPEPDLEAEP